MVPFKKVYEAIKEWWDRYQAKKKSDALYYKLHRYHVDGKPAKFTQKAAVKAGKAALKQQMKKNSEINADVKKAREEREKKKND